MDINVIPTHVQAEFSQRKVEAMLQWLEFIHNRGHEIPYDCRWWLDEFSPTWARAHTFRNCMKHFITLIENPPI